MLYSFCGRPTFQMMEVRAKVSLGVHSQCEAPGGWWTPKKYYHVPRFILQRQRPLMNGIRSNQNTGSCVILMQALMD